MPRCPVYDRLDEAYRTWLSLGAEWEAYEVKLRRDAHRSTCSTCAAQTAELTRQAKKAKHPQMSDESDIMPLREIQDA